MANYGCNEHNNNNLQICNNNSQCCQQNRIIDININITRAKLTIKKRKLIIMVMANKWIKKNVKE